MKRIALSIMLLLIFLILPRVSNSQIIRATGNPAEASSQTIFYYDLEDTDSTIQITNTNDTEGVWIHVQIFRSFDVTNNEFDADLNKVICDERNFVDFLTPNDTHVYDMDQANFPKNTGEAQTSQGEITTLGGQLDDTLGFVVITPVVSENDFTAISFQYMIGTTTDDDDDWIINSMGRDAVDFATGETVADGIPLDGVSNGFVVLQPGELLFNFTAESVPDSVASVVGIVFQDQYGPSGLLGYGVLPGVATWTSFIFDFNEDPTSCGNREIGCFVSLGLNNSLTQSNTALNPAATGTDDLCSGTETPQYAEGNSPNFGDPDFFGWTKIFVSGLDDFENMLGAFRLDEDDDGASWMYTNN